MTLPQRKADAGQKGVEHKSDGIRTQQVDAASPNVVSASEKPALVDPPKLDISEDVEPRLTRKEQKRQPIPVPGGRIVDPDQWLLRWSQMQVPLVATLSLIAGIFLWHLATTFDLNYFINFENIPPPLEVGAAFLTHLGDSEFHTHILVSLRRIAIAYSLAVALGIGVGLLVGRSRMVRAAVLPYIEIVRPIPAVAWIPLAILMWPTEESSIVYITFLGALFPIILNTVHGVEQTPEVLVRAALSLGAKRMETFFYVVLPAALPSIAAGLAIGMGVSWFSLLAGEIISGQYGIGYFTWNAYSMINYPDIIVGMLVIGGLGSLSTYVVKLAMRPSLRWNKSVR